MTSGTRVADNLFDHGRGLIVSSKEIEIILFD